MNACHRAPRIDNLFFEHQHSVLHTCENTWDKKQPKTRQKTFKKPLNTPEKQGETKIFLLDSASQPEKEKEMCNGETGRAAQGGAIVILKPAAFQTTPTRPSLHREMSLRLAEDASSGRTMALLDRPSQSLLCPASASASATAGAAYILIQ